MNRQQETKSQDSNQVASLGRAQTNLAKLLLPKDTTGAHQSSKKQKCFRARFSRKHFARCTCQNVLESTFAFLLDWCVPVISLIKENTFEHVLAKALLPKAALLDWSAPGLIVKKIGISTTSAPCLIYLHCNKT